MTIGMPFPRPLSDERGFTLIEVLVTMLILVVGIGGAIALIDGANARTVVTKEREAATGLTREVLEDARSVPYKRLTPTGTVTELQALPGLADTTPSTLAWTVQRRNQTYALKLSVCSVDDAKDDYGDKSGANFCSTSGTGPDKNPDDYKRLTVTATWKRGSMTRTVQQTGIVNNEAASTGPGVEFTGQTPAGELITTPGLSSVEFNVLAEDGTVAIQFAVDGAVVDTAANQTTATFKWDIDAGGTHVPDGTYIISVTAFDADGVPGVTRSRTIRLNREAPEAPKDTFGGWNPRLGFTDVGDIVDLQWVRNNEPDIIGYRVYRSLDGTSWELVPGCNFSDRPSATDCSDLNPPAGSTIQYRVVALDENPFTGAAREGTPSATVTAVRGNDQPNGPASVTAGVVDGDSVLLSWPASDPVTPPYSGSNVIFYRVYRDGTALGDRIGRSGQEFLTSFRDNGAAAGTHQYWVAAVDENFSESKPTGPVTLP
jgi:prepilin-type N-terminal cleavage/methylation domain-containing protein